MVWLNNFISEIWKYYLGGRPDEMAHLKHEHCTHVIELPLMCVEDHVKIFTQL